MGMGWYLQSRQNDMSSLDRRHGHGHGLFLPNGSINTGDTMAPSNSSFNNQSGNTTSSFDNFVQQLLATESTQHRETVLVTSALSIGASLMVIGIILFDARSFQRSRIVLKNGKIQTGRPFWTPLHPAEVFALAVAVASVIQSVIFIGVQSTTLDSQWALGCETTAQILWPASWLVGVMIFVFSLEIMVRSLRAPRFKPRGRWAILVCAALVILAMFGFWLWAFLSKSNQKCWGSLLLWTLHFARPALVLSIGLILASLIIAAVLIAQLIKTIQMEKSERLAATRIVYALGLNVVILAFVLPFWITVVSGHLNRIASEIADIVVTLNGLLQAILHVILRVNSETLAIRPKQTPWAEKRNIRIFGPNDVNIHEYISSPLLLKRDSNGWSRAPKDVDSLNPPPAFQTLPPTPRPIMIQPINTGAQRSPAARPAISTPKRAQPSASYSLFPTEASRRIPVESWVTEFSTDSDEIEPPPPLFTRRHGRNDSTQTSETVEFALRLSDAPPGLLSPIAPTPIEPAARSPVSAEVSAEEGLLSPVRYVPPSAPFVQRPRTPTSPALTEVTEIVEAEQATTVAFERPKVQASLSTLKVPKFPKRTVSIRDSFAFMQSQRRRHVDKSLPPLPRDSTLDSLPPIVTAPLPTADPQSASASKTPNWREASKQPRPQISTQQRVPYKFPSPVEESWPLQTQPEWI